MKKYLISGFNTVQDVKLEAGTYTLVAYVKSMHGDVYTFALGDGTDWEEFSIDVIQGQLCKVWLTFTIDKKATKFKPIANNFSESLPVYVTDLQLTRGNIPVEAGASPFDIDKILDDLHDEIDGIEDFTNEAFADGLLNREEKTQLRASLDAIGSIVESVKGSYNKLLDNPFIHESTMDDITEKYDDFIASWDGDPQGLKPVILRIIKDDNIVDQNERDEKDRALNAFNLALYEYNQAEKEVYNDVQADIDEAVIKATYWSIKASAPVIYKDANSAIASGVHTPVTVTGELRSGTTTTQGGFISIQPNGGAESTATASPRTIAPTNAEGKTSYTVRLYEKADKATLLDTMTIPVVFKGASGVNAINAILSNEADVLPASPEGVVSDYAGSGTIIRVFEGATELTYGTGNRQYQVSASGSGINVGTSSTVGNTRVYGVASSMTSDNATITFTISGKTSSGASFSLTKVQTFAKSRVGQKGKDGKDGKDGYTPVKGTDYFDGKDGQDGTSQYLWVGYSNNSNGSGFDQNPANKKYIGIATTTNNSRPTGYSSYNWSLIKGADGIAGEKGSDGRTSYLHIKYSNDGGKTFTSNNGETVGKWIGQYVDFTEKDSDTIGRYTWNKVAGEDGKDGKDGVDGTDGKGIEEATVTYQNHTNGTSAPTGVWRSTVPAPVKGRYLWTRTVTKFTEGADVTTYSVSYYATDGQKGADGKGVSSTTIHYQQHTNGSIAPTGTWLTTIPTPVKGRYLWTRTTITYTTGSPTVYYSTSYYATDGKDGVDGADGADGKDGSSYLVMGYWNANYEYQLSDAGIPVVKQQGSATFLAYKLIVPKSTVGQFINTGTNKEWELVDSSEFTYMLEAYIETLQAELITAEKIEALDIRAKQVRTSVNGARTEIDSEGIKVFNALENMNIRFGLRDGYAIMEYYDNNGLLLYDLGPAGIGGLDVREERWLEVRKVFLDHNWNDGLTFEINRDKYKNNVSDGTTYYRYVSKIVAGINQDEDNDGRIFTSPNIEAPFIPNAIYFPPVFDAGYSIGDYNDERIYPPEMSTYNEPVYATHRIRYVPMEEYRDGRVHAKYNVYWNEVVTV